MIIGKRSNTRFVFFLRENYKLYYEEKELAQVVEQRSIPDRRLWVRVSYPLFLFSKKNI